MIIFIEIESYHAILTLHMDLIQDIKDRENHVMGTTFSLFSYCYA